MGVQIGYDLTACPLVHLAEKLKSEAIALKICDEYAFNTVLFHPVVCHLPCIRSSIFIGLRDLHVP
jgi:hypothetical protein